MHFSSEEFDQRLRLVQADLSALGLEGLLVFAPESQYYLTGYDTFGFAMFQCLVVPAKGAPHLLTREPDRRQALHTSTLGADQVHIWVDRADVNPYRELDTLLGEVGLHGKQLGIETRTVGLTAWHWQQLESTLRHSVTLAEASDVVGLRRRVKSSTEIEYTRRAAQLSDDALSAGLGITIAGAFEGDILAEMQGAVFRGGGDYAGNEFVIGSGDGALLCRYFAGRRHLDPVDQLTLEWSGAYRRYHAAMMRTVIIGAATPKQMKMHEAAVEALLACEAAIRPGDPMGNVFDAHARVFDRHGLSDARMNACGYGMGAVSYTHLTLPTKA